MRVAYVTTVLQHGGSEMLRLVTAKELQKSSRFDAAFICLGPQDTIGREIQALGYPVYALDQRHYLSPWGAHRLAMLLHHLQPSVVHSAGVEANIMTAAATWHPKVKGSRTKFVAEEIGVPTERTWRGRFLSSWALRSAGVVVAHARAVQDYVVQTERVPPARVAVQPPVIDQDRFSSLSPRQAPIKGALHLLSIGRLEWVKGHDVLLAAVAQVTSRNIAVETTIVGGGSRRSALEHLARDLGIDVTFTGATSRLEQHLEWADVFVMPSRTEALGVAMTEAMAAGLPVIATKVGGIPEVIGGSGGAFLVDPTANDIARGIEHFASLSQTARAHMSTEARKSTSDFTPGRYVEFLYNLYAAVQRGDSAAPDKAT